MRTIAAAVASFLALAACSHTPSPAEQSARNICAIAYGDPELDPVRGRVAFEDDMAVKAPLANLSDTARPTAAQRDALVKLDAANRRCWDAWTKAGTSPYIESARAKVAAALAALISGQSTFGDYNRAHGAAVAEMRSQQDEADARNRTPYGGGFGTGIFGGTGGVGIGLGVFH
jgi:hypothetical protein